MSFSFLDVVVGRVLIKLYNLVFWGVRPMRSSSCFFKQLITAALLLVPIYSASAEANKAHPYVRFPEEGEFGYAPNLPTQDCEFNNGSGISHLRPTFVIQPPNSQVCETTLWDKFESYWFDKENVCDWEKNNKNDLFAFKGTSGVTISNGTISNYKLEISSLYDKTLQADSTASYKNVLLACERTDEIGCFPYGTKIKLADGSEKLVQDIKKGDLIQNPVNGQAKTVKRIIESLEKLPLVELGYGKTKVRVTRTHPVLTAAGMKRAIDLKLEDSVKGTDGSFHKLDLLNNVTVDGGVPVVNFELDADPAIDEQHLALADGVVVGDFTLQLKLTPIEQKK